MKLPILLSGRLPMAAALIILATSLHAAPVPLVDHSDGWRYRKGTSAVQANWKTVADAGLDGTWLGPSPGGFGYGDGDDATPLSDMGGTGGYTTLYIRRTFNVASALDPTLHVILTVDYDDAFIAYLDGTELYRSPLVPGAAGVEPAFNARATGTHEASAGNSSPQPPLVLDTGAVGTRLPVGDHILAVLGLNESTGSSDFSLIVDLDVDTPPLGSITEDTTWTLDDSPYTATSDITVASGVTLTIEPGVTVLFGPGRRMLVNGRLLAEGTADQPITFTRSGTSGTWSQLYFAANNTTSVIAHAFMSYYANSAIEAHDTTVHLDTIDWVNSTAQVVDLHNSSVILLNSIIPGGAGNEPVHFSNMPPNGHALIKGCIFGPPQGYNDSIDFTGGNRPGPIAEFIDNVFLAAVDDCFDMDATDAHIEGNIFMNVLQDGQRDSSSNPITTGEGNGTSELVVCRNFFYNCEHTVLLKDSGSTLMQNNTIVHLVTNALARTSSGALIPPGIIPFGEPWRGRPLGAGALFEGNIAYDLHPVTEATPFPNYSPASSFLVVSKSLIQGAAPWPGEGNLATDPLFANLAGPMTYQNIKDNLMLLAGSPCLGTGPNGLDMGANVPEGATITGEPVGTTTDTSATLTVAGPGIYAYRWKLNDGPWSNEVPLTNSFLITPTLFDDAQPIQLTDLAEGDYTVYVVGKNSAGSWQSTNSPTASKTWTVGAEGTIEITQVSHDGLTFSFHFNAQAGQSYTVQHREHVDSGTWEILSNILSAPLTGDFEITDTPADARSRFYRVKSP